MPERPPGVGGRAARGCDSAPEWRKEGRALDGTETEPSYGEGSWAPGNALGVSKRGRKDRDRRQTGQEGGPEEVEGGKEKGKGLGATFPHTETQFREGLRR